jgi:hypothetical protein
MPGSAENLSDSSLASSEESLMDAYADSLNFEEMIWDPSVDSFGEDPNMDYGADPELSDDVEYMVDETDDRYKEIIDGDMDIEKDRLVSTILVRVFRPDYSDRRDSVLAEVEKRLSITPDRIPATVVVEKWISPVNFKGYKFNQRKLILFGVRDNQRVAIYYYINQYYFALGERIYELDEALAFESFQNLADTALVRQLRTYENSL